jgi:NADH dehydrogenase FAD-containing subunit
MVTETLQVEGFEDIYAIGDVAAAKASHGTTLRALAQVAKQQGVYLGNALANLIQRNQAPQPFRFHNRGNTAVIGRHAAVFDFGRWQMKGRLAWFKPPAPKSQVTTSGLIGANTVIALWWRRNCAGVVVDRSPSVFTS